MTEKKNKLTAVFVVTDLQRLLAGCLIAKYSEPCVMCLTRSQELYVDINTLLTEKPEIDNIIIAGVKMTHKNIKQIHKFIKQNPSIPVKWYIKREFIEEERVKPDALEGIFHIYSDPKGESKSRFRDAIQKDFKVSEADFKEYSELFDYFRKNQKEIKSEVLEYCSGSKSGCSEDKAMWWLTLQWAIQKTRSFGRDDAVYNEIKELWQGKIDADKKNWLKQNAEILEGRLMGSSAVTRAILKKVDNLAKFPSVPVIFYGATGTGKELLSSMLHLRSRRKGKYIKINCAGLPENILESTLFGSVKGSFTGAENTEGLVKEADGGTLFLDEIAEMPSVVQAKLLRFVQFKTYRKVGDTKEQKVDVRIIAATNTDLRRMVREGRFRADLLHRLAGEEIMIPELKDRKDDIDDIANRYYMEFCMENDMSYRFLTDEEQSELKKHDWPGNVRQLQRVIRKAVMYFGPAAVKYDFKEILKDEEKVHNYGIYKDEEKPEESGYEMPAGRLISEDQVADEHARYVYEAVGKNKTEALKVLKICKNTLDKRLGKNI